MANGHLCHVRDSSGHCRTNAGDRGTLWEMVSSFLQAAGDILNRDQGESCQRLAYRYGRIGGRSWRDVHELSPVRNLRQFVSNKPN